MISDEHLPDALKALHEIILKSRALAHAQVGEDGELFDLLDSVEYLVAVMYEKNESTKAFCEFLHLVLEKSGCPGALIALRRIEDRST